MTMEFDHLDKLAASVFDGYLVRKGPRQEILAPIPGSHLCGRVPAWPLLRQR